MNLIGDVKVEPQYWSTTYRYWYTLYSSQCAERARCSQGRSTARTVLSGKALENIKHSQIDVTITARSVGNWQTRH